MADLLSVDLVGARGALGRFESLTRTGVREETLVVAEELRVATQGVYRAAAPRRKQANAGTAGSTPFAESIEGRLVPTGKGFNISVATSEGDLARWIREGTRPHEIVPRSGRALSFYWERAGGHVAFARVHHPGTRPNPWEEKARVEAELLLRDGAKRWAQRIVTRLVSA